MGTAIAAAAVAIDVVIIVIIVIIITIVVGSGEVLVEEPERGVHSNRSAGRAPTEGMEPRPHR